MKLLFKQLYIFLLSMPFAFAGESKVHCPTVNLITKNAFQLGTVTLQGTSGYRVSSENDCVYDTVNKRWWLITTEVIAKNYDTALAAGKKNVKNIIKLKNPYAKMEKYTEFNNLGEQQHYTCSYVDIDGHSTVTAVSLQAHPPGSSL